METLASHLSIEFHQGGLSILFEGFMQIPGPAPKVLYALTTWK